MSTDAPANPPFAAASIYARYYASHTADPPPGPFPAEDFKRGGVFTGPPCYSCAQVALDAEIEAEGDADIDDRSVLFPQP